MNNEFNFEELTSYLPAVIAGIGGGCAGAIAGYRAAEMVFHHNHPNDPSMYIATFAYAAGTVPLMSTIGAAIGYWALSPSTTNECVALRDKLELAGEFAAAEAMSCANDV